MKESESRGQNNSLLIFTIGDHAASGKLQTNPKGFAELCTRKRAVDTTDESPKDETAVWY
jgi:hypothetical protein